MRLAKESPAVFALLVLGGLVFVGGVGYAAYVKFVPADKLEKQCKSAEKTLADLAKESPAHTAETTLAIQKNLDELKAVYERQKKELMGDAAAEFGEPFAPKAAQFCLDMLTQTGALKTQCEEAGIVVEPEAETFGFADYVRPGANAPEEKDIAPLGMQVRVIRTLVGYLAESAKATSSASGAKDGIDIPVSLKGVYREKVESNDKVNTRFVMDQNLSAKVPGILDAVAFKIEFTGKTDTLRRFMEPLAARKLPIVVRNVEVRRAAGEVMRPGQIAQPVAPGIIGGNVANRPVVSDTFSTFSVTVELLSEHPAATPAPEATPAK